MGPVRDRVQVGRHRACVDQVFHHPQQDGRDDERQHQRQPHAPVEAAAERVDESGGVGWGGVGEGGGKDEHQRRSHAPVEGAELRGVWSWGGGRRRGGREGEAEATGGCGVGGGRGWRKGAGMRSPEMEGRDRGGGQETGEDGHGGQKGSAATPCSVSPEFAHHWPGVPGQQARLAAPRLQASVLSYQRACYAGTGFATHGLRKPHMLYVTFSFAFDTITPTPVRKYG
eukprot:352753-Chlamydomonas_euryale.AAC.1